MINPFTDSEGGAEATEVKKTDCFFVKMTQHSLFFCLIFHSLPLEILILKGMHQK